MTPEKQRSGIVTIVGRPNSGKSTLLNALVGEKISIVTEKPQTTRSVVRGIVTRPEGQIVFLDTPGVHKPIHRMNDLMMKAVREAMNEVDALVLLVDASVEFGRGDEFTLELIKPVKVPKLLALNKTDKVPKRNLLPQIEKYSKLDDFQQIIPMSARTGDNVEVLLAALYTYIPEGPQYYPEDQISDSQERALAAELIREQVIRSTHDELPYSTAVVIDRFEEGDALHRIYATIYVDKETQKGIVIGKGGQLLKQIGTAARLDLEPMLGRKVYLELRVKVTRGWRDDENVLKNLGLG